MFVNDLLSLIPERYKIHNKRRFQDEFGDPPSSSSEDEDEQGGSKEVPEWRRVFSGNNDDCFRIGLQISTSSLRLFTDFYHSDIIVCSPLGLRLVTATQDERVLTKKGDTDFLSSIEIFIADRAGVLEMQNWENVALALENSNRVPKKNIEVDLNRIYDWALNEQGSYYRQNLVLLILYVVFEGVLALMTHCIIEYDNLLRASRSNTNSDTNARTIGTVRCSTRATFVTRTEQFS